MAQKHMIGWEKEGKGPGFMAYSIRWMANSQVWGW